MSLAFRPAAPDDADAAIPLIHASGPEVFDYVFCTRTPRDAQVFLRNAFISGRGRFGWRNHTVACLDDRVVGIGTAYGSETHLRFFLEDGYLIARHCGPGAIGVMLRGVRSESVIHPPRGDEWMIAHLAAQPDLRGQGIGARMINELLHLGRKAGKSTAVLDVSVENRRAQALYERVGFTIVAERSSIMRNRFGRICNHRRMALPLAVGA
jgi:ribosomal protein S18 acetylase RimI-like enzyme